MIGEVQRDERGEWVVIADALVKVDDEGNETVMVPASRVRRGSLAHQVHAASDERLAATLPRIRP